MKIYDVGATLYTLNGTDVWECMSAHRKSGQLPTFWFLNTKTGETHEGTVEELPEFREIEHVEQAA